MPVPAPEPLGPLLRRLRRGAALSQDELAARSGVSARTVSDLERGQRASAHFETLRLLADALELAAEDRARLIRTAQAPWIGITLHRPPGPDLARRELPAPVTSLIGREREIADLEQALAAAATRLITLTGPGGVGKTRLAAAVAATAAAHVPGGVAWVDLAPVREPDAVMAAIASGLGLDRPRARTSCDELRAAFGERRFLLVLDNFEQVIEAAPAVAELLAAVPSLTVLVTSRAPLRVAAEVEYPVAPLRLPEPDAPADEIQAIESVRLFVDRARAVQRDFALGPENSEAVARICRRLDGFPLAIELAASRANVLVPREILERLEQRLPLLSRGARDAPPRQQTMSNTIAWSYHLLDADAQRLFRLLSVFVGGFTPDTVEWVMRAEPSSGMAAINLLTTLTENNLVFRLPDSAAGARFTMYETIREFGLAQLSEYDEVRAASDLLARYCRSLARYGESVPTCIVPAPWVALLDQERSNIRAAHRYLTRANDPERLLEFVAPFGNYLYLRGPIPEAWSWFEQALAVSEPRSTPVRLQALYWASHLATHMKLIEPAIQLGNEALRISQELGDPGWRAAIVHCLAIIQDECGHYDESTALFEEELRLWAEIGVPGLSGFAYMYLSCDAFRRGDAVRAGALVDRATEIFYDMDGLGWVAATKWLRGVFSVAEGNLDGAAGHFRDCLRLSVSQDTTMIHHKGLLGLAFVASELALYERAAHLLGAVESCITPTGRHFDPEEQSVFDQTLATCRSVMETGAFEAVRQRGATLDHAWWIESGEVIKGAAAQRARDRGAGDRSTETARPQVLRSHVAAD